MNESDEHEGKARKDIDLAIDILKAKLYAEKCRDDLPKLDPECEHKYPRDASYCHEHSSKDLTCFQCIRCDGILQIVKDSYLDTLYARRDSGELDNFVIRPDLTNMNSNSLENRIGGFL